MKNLLLSFLVLSFYTEVFSQGNIPVDSIYSLIRKNNIHSTGVDWKLIDKKFAEKLSASKTDVDSIKSFLLVFEILGDVHSNIYYKNNNYGNYPDFDDKTLERLLPLVQKSYEQTGIIKKLRLNENYLYLQIPGINAWGDQVSDLAQQISDSICASQPDKLNGMIIDLRLNGGGQLSSMAAGLNQVFGNNSVGSGINNLGETVQKMEIKDHNFYINDRPMTSIQNKCTSKINSIPVVVLTGPVTRSSGSIVAMFFKGRANTYFLGEPTAAGYSTGNEYFYFSPELNINLSTTFNLDRNGRIYKEVVTPDKIISSENNFEQLAEDQKVKEALDWLKNKNKIRK